MILIEKVPQPNGFYAIKRISGQDNVPDGYYEIPSELESKIKQYNGDVKPVVDDNGNLVDLEKADIIYEEDPSVNVSESELLNIILDQEVRIAELESKISS